MINDSASRPRVRVPPVIAAKLVDEEIEKISFRPTAEQAPMPVSVATARPSSPEQIRNGQAETYRSRIDEQFIVGRVMTALFPEGVQIASEDRFATVRLFNALVASVAQFARSGLVEPTHIRDVIKQAEMLDEMVSRQRDT